MASKYSLENLRQNAGDIARPYHFQLSFSGGCFDGGVSDDDLVVFARGAELPTVESQPMHFNLGGFNYQVAGIADFQPISVRLMIDHNYEVVESILKSYNKVFDFDDRPKYKIPNKYFGKVKISGLENQDKKKIMTYTLHMAYIGKVGNVAYDQGTKDSILSMDIIIYYNFFTTKKEQSVNDDISDTVNAYLKDNNKALDFQRNLDTNKLRENYINNNPDDRINNGGSDYNTQVLNGLGGLDVIT